ncbi:hypothetical protein EK904_006205 [Melospiza melodia maxima]|nr:hypothetical protein EK904_006205 [Melospiza melodia maxima]
MITQKHQKLWMQSWSELKLKVVHKNQGALVTCSIVETSVKISASPLSCAGNSLEAEGVFYLNSSSPGAQKAPPLLEIEELLPVSIRAGIQREHWRRVTPRLLKTELSQEPPCQRSFFVPKKLARVVSVVIKVMIFLCQLFYKLFACNCAAKIMKRAARNCIL